MALLDDLTLGRFWPGDSPLHRLDPRIKLVGFPLLAIAAFSSASPGRLGLLGLTVILLLRLSRLPWRLFGKGIWMFRWLLLFTLLLHLFISPGRTLFGLSWLSLDGLLRGLQVGAQVVLAVCFSSLLSLTTPPQMLAQAFGALFSPLQRWGCPIREATGVLLLVLHFIPQFREEGQKVLGQFRAEGLDPGRGSLVERGQILRRMLAPLLLGLVDRADALAHGVAAGAPGLEPDAQLPPFPSVQGTNGLLLAAVIFLLLLLFFLT